MKRALIIQHQGHSDAGRVGQGLAARGYDLDIRKPALGDDLPDNLKNHDCVVIFGGPMSINDDLPFLKQEIQWTKDHLLSDKPFLGICLGGQMIAKALGATVRPRDDQMVEVGFREIEATDAGVESGLFPETLQAFQWHGEGFTLPDGAENLASSPLFPHQAMRMKDAHHIVGLQFHPELTQAMHHKWVVTARARLSDPGADTPSKQLHDVKFHSPPLKAWLEQFLDHWLD